MKKLLKTVLIYCLWCVIIFLALSFYYVNFNPVFWHKDARFTMSFLGIGMGIVMAVFYYTME